MIDDDVVHQTFPRGRVGTEEEHIVQTDRVQVTGDAGLAAHAANFPFQSSGAFAGEGLT